MQIRQAAFLKEASTLLSLDHPNVIRICGVSLDYRPWVMVFESLRYGDVEHVLRLCRGRQITIGAAEQVYLCGQVAAGMAHVAAHRYTHMDLAARNVLLGERNMVKIADFGNAQAWRTNKDSWKLNVVMEISQRWCAPEVSMHMIRSGTVIILITHNLAPSPAECLGHTHTLTFFKHCTVCISFSLGSKSGIHCWLRSESRQTCVSSKSLGIFTGV